MSIKFNRSLISKDDKIIVGVSGGVDSMVLLSMLINLKSKYHLDLVVVHMNYHKRPTSDQNEALVKRYCEDHKILFQSFSYQGKSKGNFQRNARNERYHKFIEMAHFYHASKIALAHHLDDQTETILMRLVRGSSFKGYAGMQDISSLEDLSLIRPLFNSTKEQIYQYASDYHIPFEEDESNQEDDYTRNRFRNHIIPLLKKENSKMEEHLSDYASDIQSAYRVISKEKDQFVASELTRNNQIIQFSISSFKLLERIVQKEILKEVMNEITGNTLEFTNKNYDDIIKTITSGKPNITKEINKKCQLIKSYDLLTFQPNKQSEMKPFEYVIDHYQKIVLPNNDIIEISNSKSIIDGNSVELWYNDLDFIFPITIRNRREKDQLNYAYGTKKLKRVFIDNKIPKQVRQSIPILCDSLGNIIYIPGIYKHYEKEMKFSIHITYMKGTKSC